MVRLWADSSWAGGRRAGRLQHDIYMLGSGAAWGMTGPAQLRAQARSSLWVHMIRRMLLLLENTDGRKP